MKICTCCRISLKESEFYANKSTICGLDNFCKKCRKALSNWNRGKFKETTRYVIPAKIIISQGKLVCVCCGNKNYEWLQIDHIIPVKRTKHEGNTALLSRKIVLGIIHPFNYQLLCGNCNFAKKILKKCPIDHSLD